MKRQSLVLLAVAIAGAGATGCFKDPVSDLRNGPSALNLSSSAVFLPTGDSTDVQATLVDKGGNVLPATDASWTSDDPSVATVRLDTSLVIPGQGYVRGIINAVTPTGGWTTVTATVRGVSATVRVVVTPPVMPASQFAVTGTAAADTVIAPATVGPPATLPDTIAYSAGDTLTINGTSLLNFDTSQVSVYVKGVGGTSPGFILAKTPTQLTVVFTTGTAGKLFVKHLQLVTGNASIGTVIVDSLIGDTVDVSRQRSTETYSLQGDTLTVTAGANHAFTSATTVSFGAAAGIMLTQSATTLTALSPANYTGLVTVKNVTAGLATLDALTSVVSTTINGATFPAANVNLGGGNLGDTITVTAPAGLGFSTGTVKSNVVVGNTAINTSDTAWVLSRTASTIKAFAKRGGSGKVAVTNITLGSLVIPQLATPAAMTVDSVASDFTTSSSQASAVAITIPASDTAVVYSSVPGAGAAFFTFTTTAAHAIKGNLAWFGSGCPGYSSCTGGTNTTAYTEDLDFLVCNASTACDESAADLTNYAGASTSQPENFTTSSVPAAQYWLGVLGFNVAYTIVYRMTIILQ